MIKTLFKNLTQGISGSSTERFVNKLISLKEYPGSKHICPKCGGRFHFHLVILKGRQPKMASAQAWCDDCQEAIVMDGIVPPPVWSDQATQVWDSEMESKGTND